MTQAMIKRLDKKEYLCSSKFFILNNEFEDEKFTS